MIYAKKNFIPLTHNRYEQGFEYMFCFSKGRPKTFNPIMLPTVRPLEAKNYALVGSNTKEGGYRRRYETRLTKPEKIHTNIFYYATGSNRTKHPAPFPEELARDQILTWTNEGDLVYDPFIGSGTTRKACRELNRNCIGSEISSEYCKMEEERMNKTLF